MQTLDGVGRHVGEAAWFARKHMGLAAGDQERD
jgi:hypothetical protein